MTSPGFIRRTLVAVCATGLLSAIAQPVSAAPKVVDEPPRQEIREAFSTPTLGDLEDLRQFAADQHEDLTDVIANYRGQKEFSSLFNAVAEKYTDTFVAAQWDRGDQPSASFIFTKEVPAEARAAIENAPFDTHLLLSDGIAQERAADAQAKAYGKLWEADGVSQAVSTIDPETGSSLSCCRLTGGSSWITAS